MKALRIGGLALGVILVIVLAWVAVTLLRARGGLPPWDGTHQVSGLDGTVTVTRDVHGVPYLQATTEADLYFAQGFVHAQDRFWQMALARQQAAGRLAEWLGGAVVRSDRLNRLLGVEAAAERHWAAFPASEKPLLEAYARGVNAWLASAAYRRPPEMVLLHVHPEPWRPHDTWLVHWQIQSMLGGWGSEAIRTRAALHGAHPAAVEMLQPQVVDAPVILDEGPVATSVAARKEGTASNSWTLSGAHTASGAPLLANDPQLAATMPNFWHLQHHAVQGQHRIGASVPGIPGIVVGHNNRIAWGITNASIDVNDITLIEPHPDDPGRYRTGPSAPWQPFAMRVETVAVRFGTPVTDTIRATPEGVVVPPTLTSLPLTDDSTLTPIYRVGGLEEETTPAAFLRLVRAGSVQEGIDALRLLTGPPLNISLADVAGSIGYVAAGRIPRRPAAHATSVAYGPDDANTWSYLPYPANPQVVNPASGRIVTANHRIVGPDYPHYLTDYWASPDRAQRILEMLDSLGTIDPAAARMMQQDVVSPVARTLLPLLLQVEPASDADGALLDVLDGWRGRFDLNSPAPTVFLTWLEQLQRRVLDDELGPALRQYRVGNYASIVRALDGTYPAWCDDIATADRAETCADQLAHSLTATRELLEEHYGTDPEAWRWASAGALRIPHLGLAGLPLLDSWFSRRVPMPGGPESMFTNFVDPSTAPRFATSIFNSSLQAVYDLSDLDATEFMMAGGQSGHFRSPYYDNLLPHWAAGERIRIPTDMGDIDAVATLHLRPATRVASSP